MASQATNMKTLLSAIKTKLLAYQGTTLSAISGGWYRGVFVPKYGFPALAIMPVEEVISKYTSSFEYRVRRTVDIEVYSKQPYAEDTVEQCMDLISAVKDIAQANIDWDDNAIDTTMPDETYRPVGEGIYAGILRMHILSTESRPSVIGSNSVVETDSKSMIQAIHTVFTNHIKGTSPSLSKINKIYRSYDTPPMKYPAITLLEDNLIRDRKWAGQDHPTRNFRVKVQTYALGREKNLDDNLDLVEIVKDIIQKNYKWGGKAYDSQIQGISYDTVDMKDYPLYVSTIRFNVFGVEPLN